jgi:hypothetical protein
MVAVWAGCLINLILFGLGLGLGHELAVGGFRLATADLGGEVDAAIWVETGDVGWLGSEEMPGDCCVPTVGSQCLSLYTMNHIHKEYLRLKEGLRHNLLQRGVIKHRLTALEHANQMCISELTLSNLDLDLLLDA